MSGLWLGSMTDKKLIRVLTSTSKSQNNDQQHAFLDLVNDPVIAHTNPIKTHFIDQFLITERAGLVSEFIDRVCDLLCGLLIEASEKLKSRPLDLDIVFHRPSSDLASSHLIDSSFLARRAAR